MINAWKENGITKECEYGILTNEIYSSWSGMNASEYKPYGLKQNKEIAKRGGKILKNNTYKYCKEVYYHGEI